MYKNTDEMRNCDRGIDSFQRIVTLEIQLIVLKFVENVQKQWMDRTPYLNCNDFFSKLIPVHIYIFRK